MEKLFNEVLTKYDSKNRQVMICNDDKGYFVFKPRTGFKSKYFENQEDESLLEILDYQTHCGHNNAFYRDGDLEVEEPEQKGKKGKKGQKDNA